jgi:hypothetical protein
MTLKNTKITLTYKKTGKWPGQASIKEGEGERCINFNDKMIFKNSFHVGVILGWWVLR